MWPFSSGETQPTIRLYEDMEVRRTKSKAKAEYVFMPKSLFAFHRLREYQGQLRLFGKPLGYFLVLDNRSSVPISPYNVVQPPVLAGVTEPNSVALKSHDYAKTENEALQHKTRYYDIIGIAVLAMAVITAVVILAKVTHKL